MAAKYCEKCNKTMEEINFYTYRNGEKTELCKKCLTMHIDNFNPETYVWLLEKMDVPYIPKEWEKLRNKAYAKGPLKMNGMSVFGKYLSQMKLNQWSDLRWKDTERLMKEEEEEKQKYLKENPEAQKKNEEIERLYKEGSITEAQYKTYFGNNLESPSLISHPELITGGNPNGINNQVQIQDPSHDLTEEDIIYLSVKWGQNYKPNEWIELEKKYEEMMQSFDIQDSDTIGTLILTCKTYLKMNQSIDCGDIESFQKLSRAYNELRKSAKFTAAQNKEEQGDYVDSIGELVAICEKDGFIPRYCTDIPQDKVDVTLKDMKEYVNKLVTKDLGFGQQIEDSLRRIEIEKKMADDLDVDDLDDIDIDVEDEISDHYDNILEQQAQDQKLLNESSEG